SASVVRIGNRQCNMDAGESRVQQSLRNPHYNVGTRGADDRDNADFAESRDSLLARRDRSSSTAAGVTRQKSPGIVCLSAAVAVAKRTASCQPRPSRRLTISPPQNASPPPIGSTDATSKRGAL